jgi:carboxylesterase type B
VYVPGKALKNPSLKLPVAVWIYGGAYVFGSKDTLQPELPFYDGSGLMGAANNGLIFVTMNYRLGAYGFLAGTTMEKEGLPNAGLWDQRAAFQWVKDYISLLGGDPTRVTAMGESAGAGSILHHLVGQGGKLDPLFCRAILQSPAFQMMWDRAGTVQDTFASFASLAGCAGQGVSCLRSASAAALAKANTAINSLVAPGSFAVGPTPDGSLIRQTPSLELATGNFWPIQSVIQSHTSQESVLFVSGAIQTDGQFDSFLTSIFPNYTVAAGVNARVTSFYPSPSAKSSPYRSQSERVGAFLRDSCFTCNVRYLTTALGDSKVWNMQYAVSPGWHGTDLVPTFYNPAFTPDSFLTDLATLMVPVIGPLVAGISAAMQSYFASYITTGDPNTNRKLWNLPPAVRWDHPDSTGEKVRGVVNVGDWGLSTRDDDQNLKGACDFWSRFAGDVTALGGYAPPGAVVSPGSVGVGGDASRRYAGGNAGS